MSSVIPFNRMRVTKDDRTHRPGECTHRHIKLDSRGGVVTCSECRASLTPFWALTMLAEQYTVALNHIERLDDRIALANARIAELSAALDTRDAAESQSNALSSAP